MNFEQEINGFGRICMPLCKRIVNTDISEDFTLPDYESEIRRVLYVKETMLPPAKFISGNKLDVNGVVDYTLVYVSSEGKLCSAPLSAEYSFSLPLEGMGDMEISEGVSVMVHSVADASTVRVSSPRRLQIRSRIRSCVNAWGKKACNESIEGLEDASTLQRRSEQSHCADVVCESSDVVSLVDEYRLPDINSRVALADGNVFVESCRIEGDTLRATGDVVLKLLIVSEDGKSDRVVRKLPFDAQSELDGIEESENTLCRVSGSVTDLVLNVEEGVVNIEANLVLEICMAQNSLVSYTADVYSTAQNVQTVVSDIQLPVVLENQNFNFSQSERLPLTDVNFPENAEIVDVCAKAFTDEVLLEDGKYVIKGNCRYDLICMKDGEYSYCEARAPFRYELDGEEGIDGFDVVIDVLNSRARSDGDALSVDAELCGACTLMGNTDVTMLEKAVFTEGRENKNGEWTVCYVQNAEGIWNIAKRYGVRADDVKGDPEKDRFVIIER